MKRRAIEVKEEIRLVGCADLHITDKSPKYRKDNYWNTVQRKLSWIVDFTNSKNATLLIAGDLSENAKLSYGAFNKVTEILQRLDKTPLVVAGQHDQVFHLDNLDETPLYNLCLNGNVIMLHPTRKLKGILGQSYGRDTIAPTENTDIAVVHRGITPEEPPFFLSDMISAEDAAKEYAGFRLVVSGDYHEAFHKKIGNMDIANCGPMLRSKKDQMKVQPSVWYIVINGEDVSVERVYIPIEPAEKVFDLRAIEYDEINSIKIDTTQLRKLLNAKTDDVEFDDIVWHNFENNDFEYLVKEDVLGLLSIVE